MFKTGRNFIDGIPIEVERKSIRCINMRVAQDGVIHLSVPKRWATIADGEAFLRSKWKWAVATRAKLLSRGAAVRAPVGEEERAAFAELLGAMHAEWCARLGEYGVEWRVKSMKSLWGSCHIRRRSVVYNAELVRAPRELVEYVVVHELTHLKVSNHGPRFRALMDERLPGWSVLRRRLNKRDGFRPPPKNDCAARDGAEVLRSPCQQDQKNKEMD